MTAPMLAMSFPSLDSGLAAMLVVVSLGAFWVLQFTQLMLLEDSLFPGRFDKILWAAAFFIVSPFAPFAFLAWKWARTAESPSAAKPWR